MVNCGFFNILSAETLIFSLKFDHLINLTHFPKWLRESAKSLLYKLKNSEILSKLRISEPGGGSACQLLSALTAILLTLEQNKKPCCWCQNKTKDHGGKKKWADQFSHILDHFRKNFFRKFIIALSCHSLAFLNVVQIVGFVKFVTWISLSYYINLPILIHGFL